MRRADRGLGAADAGPEETPADAALVDVGQADPDTGGVEAPYSVPPPQAVAPTDPELLIGAMYMPGYKYLAPSIHTAPLPAWGTLVNPGLPIHMRPGCPSWPQRKPLLGWYDEGDLEVTDWQIKFALEHGITFFSYNWYRSPLEPDKFMPVLEHSLDALLQSRYRDRFHFTIIWENVAGMSLTPNGQARDPVRARRQLLEQYAPHWDSRFFSHSRYLRLGGKAVLFVYSFTELMRDFGWDPGCGPDGPTPCTNPDWLADLRNAIAAFKAAHGGVLLGCHVRGETLDDVLFAQKVSAGCDFNFAYNWWVNDGLREGRNPNNAEAVSTQIERMKQLRARQDRFMPSAVTLSVGWDNRPAGAASCSCDADPSRCDCSNDCSCECRPLCTDAWEQNIVCTNRWQLPATSSGTGDSYRALAERVRDVLLPGWKRIGGSSGKKMVLLDNWNEYVEGHFISPMRTGYAGRVADSFEYLDVIREVFTDGGPHWDQKPDATLDSVFCRHRNTDPQLCDVAPLGAISDIHADGTVYGWTLDTNRGSASLDVDVSIDGGDPTPIIANRPRLDVNQALGYGGDHGIVYKVPDAYRDRRCHSVRFVARSKLGYKVTVLSERRNTYDSTDFVCDPSCRRCP